MRAPTLKLRKPRPDAAESAPAESRSEEPTQDIAWTGTSAAATKAVTFGLWGCLLAGPTALAMTAMGVGSPAPVLPPTSTADSSTPSERAAVSAFAQDFVTTWLTSSRDDQTRLEAFIPSAARTVSLPDTPWVVTNPTVSGLQQTADGTWSATVAVTVSPTTKGAGVRRYFQVPVQYADGALAAQTLPAPVAAPSTAVSAELNYDHRATTSDPVAVAAADFLTALLVGGGDVTRFVSPGAPITAVLPAPYTTVEVTDVVADRELTEADAAPATGSSVRVLVTADAALSAAREISIQYALTMTAREGRWEVASIDPVPQVVPAQPSTETSTTSPSTTDVPTSPSSTPTN